MSDKNYKLKIGIEGDGSLDEEIKKLERMLEIRDDLKQSVDLVPDSAIKELTDLLNKQDQVNESIKKQKASVDRLRIAKEKEAAAHLKAESEVTKAIIKEQKETETLRKERAKAHQEEQKAAEKTLKNQRLLERSIIEQQKEVERLRVLKARAKNQEEKNAFDSLIREAKLTNEINRQALAKEKEAQKVAKAAEQERSAYFKLDKQLQQNKKAVKDLLASGKQLTEADKQLIKETQDLDKRLKQIDHSLGDGRRSVGLYKNAIHEAIDEMGFYGTSIGRIITILKNLQVQESTNIGSNKKFRGNMKAGLAAIAIAAALVVKELAQLNQSVIDTTDILIAKGKDLLLKGNPFETLERATQKFRIELRALQKEQQEATLKEEDFRKISDDVTLGFRERNAALKESMRLSEEREKANVKIAQGELDLVNKEIAAREAVVGAGNATNDLLDKRNEAELKLNEALDKQNSVIKENSKRERERTQQQLIQDLDLLRSKKKSSTAQLEIFRDQLNNEKIQLEERRKIAGQLLETERRTFNEQIKLLENRTGTQINQNDLLATQDNILLAQKIKNLNLSEALTDKLAEIIKKAQDSEIEGKRELKKLEDEEIKRKQKLAEVSRQIAILRLEDEVHDIETRIQQERDLYEQLHQEILKEENAFNKNIDLSRKLHADSELGELRRLYSKKLQLLDKNAENEIKNIEATVFDEKVKAAEIKKINEKLKIDKDNLSIEQAEAEKKLNKDRLKDDKELAKKRLEIAISHTDLIATQISKGLDKQEQKNNERFNKEQDRLDKELERQEARATQGLSNELELQQEKAARLEQERQKEQKRQERREKILSFYNLLAGYAKEDPNTALSKAARDIAISEAISLAFAEKGGVIGEITDKTTLKDGTLSKTHKSGDRLVVASPNEGLLNEKQMANLGGKDGFYNLQKMLDNPINDSVLFPKVPVFSSLPGMGNSPEVIERLDKIERAIVNKPVSTATLDAAGDVIKTNFEYGVKRTVKIITDKPRFRR